MDRVLAKTKAFKKPGFKKCDMNWLLIYDNLPLPHVDIETAMRYLIEHLNSYWRKNNCYKVVLIETENQLIEIHPSKWSHQPIIDLWT